MSRKFNTDKNGNSWSEDTVRAIWNKGNNVLGKSPDSWKKDKCGQLIEFKQHGNRDSPYGWEIDHITPVSRGGGDEDNNLQPLHWKNNLDKGDKLDWSCPK